MVGGGIGFFIGLHHYQEGQEWKRNEFLNGRIREFQSDPKVFIVQKILDYMYVEVELFPDKPKFEERFVQVTPALLIGALLNHSLKKDWNAKNLDEKDPRKDTARFSEEEVAVRDCFDRFFAYLDQFEQNLDSKLYETKYLSSVLEYYVARVADKRKAYAAVRQYAADYANTPAQELLKRFDCEVPPATPPPSSAKA